MGEEDDADGLGPGQADTDHGAAERPVAHGESNVEGHVVPPPPCALVRWRGI